MFSQTMADACQLYNVASKLPDAARMIPSLLEYDEFRRCRKQLLILGGSEGEEMAITRRQFALSAVSALLANGQSSCGSSRFELS